MAYAEKARIKRNEVIVKALAAGLTQSEVARITGLARARIGQIADAANEKAEKSGR